MATSDYNKWRLYESPSELSKKEKILQFRKTTGLDSEAAEDYLEEHDWDLDSAISDVKEKKKKPKDKKIFKTGDIIICIDPKPGKLPPDCVDFLMTYKKFKVLSVNDKYNIDLGHKLAENNNPYFFSPNRFELINGKAPVMKPDGTIVDSEKSVQTDSKETISNKKPDEEKKTMMDEWNRIRKKERDGLFNDSNGYDDGKW